MPQTCLIAAHDPWLIQLLRVYSEESGFRVVQAYEGQDVYPATLKERPVAIFLQADIPGQLMSHDVIKQLRRDSQTSKIPLFALSWQLQDKPDEVMGEVTTYLHEPITYTAFQDALVKAGIHCEGLMRTSESDAPTDEAVRAPRVGKSEKSSKGRAAN